MRNKKGFMMMMMKMMLMLMFMSMSILMLMMRRRRRRRTDDEDFNGSFLRVQQHQIHEHYIECSPSCCRL